MHTKDPDHVRTLENVLNDVEKYHPGILDGPKAIINFDETEVCAELLRKRTSVLHLKYRLLSRTS